jgi:RNA polymerase sigma-70 factor (ECF subfamily)
MEPTDAELIKAVLGGDTSSFEVLVLRYQPRVFGTARKYARREIEVEDIVQEVFVKAFTKLSTFRGDSPFEHWLMRLAVRTCYDFLREHQRNREQTLSEITEEESKWLERVATDADPVRDADSVAAARLVVHKLMETLSPESRLIIQLLEIEEKSLKEIAQLTGWSIPMIKVRAFRARAAMRKTLERMEKERYL